MEKRINGLKLVVCKCMSSPVYRSYKELNEKESEKEIGRELRRRKEKVFGNLVRPPWT